MTVRDRDSPGVQCVPVTLPFRASGCWNVLTTVNCCSSPLLTLSCCTALERLLRIRWFLYYRYHSLIVGCPLWNHLVYKCFFTIFSSDSFSTWEGTHINELDLCFSFHVTVKAWTVAGCLLQTVQNNTHLWIYACTCYFSISYIFPCVSLLLQHHEYKVSQFAFPQSKVLCQKWWFCNKSPIQMSIEV